jgi:hypothetical protein
VSWLTLAGCHLTPIWPDDAVAPGADAPWNYPTDVACDKRGDVDAFEVDGFLYCAADAATTKIPVDDPHYVACGDAAIPDDADLLVLFDGARARGYRIGALRDRELVNTEWEGEPILVDY